VAVINNVKTFITAMHSTLFPVKTKVNKELVPGSREFCPAGRVSGTMGRR